VAQARLSVRKIREVLRLKNEARLSDRQIGAVLGSARSTVQECLRRARSAGLSWPLPAELDDEELSARLYPRAEIAPRYPTPDFAAIQIELTHKGVTRMLLWQEYKGRHPDGCQYSAFCRDYEAWLGRQDAVRFEHTPGDKLHVTPCEWRFNSTSSRAELPLRSLFKQTFRRNSKLYMQTFDHS
jgi:hypothetical protein